MRAHKHARWYRHVDAPLLRASVHTGDVIPRPFPELDAGTEIEQWCAWLAQVWGQPPVAEAVAVASPVLADRIEAVRHGLRPDADQVRRMVTSLARYLVRMRGRATPFGAFAGVAPLHFGPQLSVRWTEDHQARTRPDAVWLAEVIARLEACPELRRRLSVMANNLVVVRGERLVVPWQPHAGDRGRGAPVEVSVRYSQPVQTVLHAARSPIPVGDLIDKLFPDVAGPAEAMVAELVARGVLITSLRPPSTSTDGLAHVLHQLHEVDAAAMAEVAPLVERLRLIHTQLLAAERTSSWVDGRPRRVTAAGMRELSVAAVQPLMLDLRLGCMVVLPSQVATEAESAAGALLRLAPSPEGDPGWREYHARFLDRYGLGAVVPVEQLIDPTAGLGFPRHFGEPELPAPTAEMSMRDQRLLVLAQQAALDGVQEVVLDDDAIDILAGEGIDELRPAPHVDVCFDVRAPTTTALAEGAFTVAVTGIGRTAIATSGRFLDVVLADDRRRMVGLYEALPVGVDGALGAQLSFPPQSTRAENVVRAPLVLPDVISLAEHHDGERGQIALCDLAVTADGDRMYVVSLSRRRVVEPVLAHAASRHAMPPLARLLSELPRATCAPTSLFDWGAAACLPFRPRVRYRRSILSPARWRISTDALPGPAATQREWTAAMALVRQRLRLPASVYVGTADRRLRLNVDDPMDLALLRAHLDGTGDATTLVEAPTAADHGWLDGRAHEIVIPLAATAQPKPAPAVVKGSGPLVLIGREHGIMPGSQVVFAKLYGHPDVFDTILTGHLPSLLAAWDEPPMWWFVRYRDPAPHLRLRLHLLDDYGQAASRVGRWAADLRRRGLIGDLTLDTYHPETGRYGSDPAMAAAEALFAADSAAVLAQLTALAAARALHPHALTAASLVDLACAVTGSRPAGMRWLIDHPDLAGHASARDRGVLRQAVSLADLDGDRPALLGITGGPQIMAAWQMRRQAAAGYTACLDGTRALTRAGRWSEAVQHAEKHNGIGQRLLDGRQVAILAHCAAGDHETAQRLLNASTAADPWEQAVAACLKVVCLTRSGEPASAAIASMVDRYLALEPVREHAVFHVRLGLTVIDLADSRPEMRKIADIIEHVAVDAADAYAAHDALLATTPPPWAAGGSRALIDMVRASGLGAGSMPAELLDDLMQSISVSEAAMTHALAAETTSAADPIDRSR